MEGGGWERPLEEKVDLEKQESGENLVCNEGVKYQKGLFLGSIEISCAGLNTSQK